MKRGLAAVAAVVLMFPAAAGASRMPTDANLVAASHIALAYWHGYPACGHPGVVVAALPEEYFGEADSASCRIVLAADAARWSPEGLCTAVAHEWGHLMLGSAFAATNPAEPWHSPDPNNIMYREPPPRFPPCEVFRQEEEAAARRWNAKHSRP